MTFDASAPSAAPNASPRDVGIELPACSGGAAAAALAAAATDEPPPDTPEDSPSKTFVKRRLSVAAGGTPMNIGGTPE